MKNLDECDGMRFSFSDTGADSDFFFFLRHEQSMIQQILFLLVV